MRIASFFRVGAGIAFALSTGATIADVVKYNIHPEQSELTITSGTILVAGVFPFPAQPVDKQSFSAALSGTIVADRTATTIAFEDMTRVVAIDHGKYLPGTPDAPQTPAPGSYAILYPTQPAIGFDFTSVTRGMVFGWTDKTAHILVGDGIEAPQEFLAAGTTWRVVEGVADLSAGNPPQTDLTTVTPFLNSTTATGSIQLGGDFERLTVPVAFQMQIFGNLVAITLNFEGTVVATRSTWCSCEWNGDKVLNSQDFFDFLTSFFANDADYNNDNVTNSQDFFDFLACFFTGC